MLRAYKSGQLADLLQRRELTGRNSNQRHALSQVGPARLQQLQKLMQPVQCVSTLETDPLDRSDQLQEPRERRNEQDCARPSGVRGDPAQPSTCRLLYRAGEGAHSLDLHSNNLPPADLDGRVHQMDPCSRVRLREGRRAVRVPTVALSWRALEWGLERDQVY